MIGLVDALINVTWTRESHLASASAGAVILNENILLKVLTPRMLKAINRVSRNNFMPPGMLKVKAGFLLFPEVCFYSGRGGVISQEQSVMNSLQPFLIIEQMVFR